MTKQSQAVRILNSLSKKYRETGMTDLGNPEDTLFATVLSARTTDKQVLRVYPGLRKRFPSLRSLARADVREIEGLIKSIGFYRNKAKLVKALAHDLLARFDGHVPRTMDELVTLPGVGRKTASVVLSFTFGVPSIAVDTHVFRVAHRLGWTRSKTPERVEKDLKSLLPERLWSEINRTIVPFGRDICRAPKPQCWRCPIAHLCPFEPKTPAPRVVR